MPATKESKRGFDRSAWDMQEFDWTGKSFYYVTVTSVLGKPVGIGGKMELLNREIHQNGYKTLNRMVLVQHGPLKARVMLEVEKQDKYDAQVLTLDEQTTADTLVVTGGLGGLSKGVKRLRERVTNRRAMEPRAIYYWCVNGYGESNNIVVFALS